MNDKLCIFCKHLNIEHSGMGSEQTGRYGEDGFSCAANHFDEYSEEGQPDNRQQLRALFLKAETCLDYEQDN